MKALTTCVEFDDFLALTLPRNARHFEEVMVITAPRDQKTPEVVKAVPNARLFVTDAFYRPPPTFKKSAITKEDPAQPLYNRGLAIEEGLDILGRQGWIVFWDADIVMPEQMELAKIEIGNLYSCRRRQCPHPENWTGQMDNWSNYPIVADTELAGYFQLFHAADPVLKTRPWYSINWRHCAYSDSEFQDRWPPHRKQWLPFDVLHLGGPISLNVWGRAIRRLDGTMPANAQACREATERMYAERRLYGLKKEQWQPKGVKALIDVIGKKITSIRKQILSLFVRP